MNIYPYKKDTKRKSIQREGGNTTTNAESRVMQPHAKECLKPPEAEEARKQTLLQKFQKECSPTDVLILDFLPLKLILEF